jgi:hypothetical protein
LSRMSIFIRGSVAVALLGVLFGVMEVAAKFYVAHGLRITDHDFTPFYRFDPALRLVTRGHRYRRHPYFGYVNMQRLDELERLRVIDTTLNMS